MSDTSHPNRKILPGGSRHTNLVPGPPLELADGVSSALRQAATLEQLLDFPDWTPSEIENQEIRDLIATLRSRVDMRCQEALPERSHLASYYSTEEMRQLEELAASHSMPIHEMQAAIVRQHLALQIEPSPRLQRGTRK